MVMHITIHYGKTGLPLDISLMGHHDNPKKPMPSIQNPEISLKSAFENPTEGTPH